MAMKHLGRGSFAAFLAFSLIGMSPSPPDEPLRLSAMRLSEAGRQSLLGYPVHDRFGVRAGEVVSVDADHRGRTRSIRIALDAGGGTKIASYNVWVDHHRVLTHQARDLLEAPATTARGS